MSLESLELRVHGEPSRPTLVYLPGIHGDWTLVTSFRLAIQDRVRFVEFSYPRTTSWSLDDYAAAIECALAERGIDQGWLLGESFGSQVVWAFLRRGLAPTSTPTSAARFRVHGVILAGGFVRYPFIGRVRFVHALHARLPLWLLNWGLRLYGQYARFRHRQAPETLVSVQEFIRRRQEPADVQAILHRYRLIAAHDPRDVARGFRQPVFALVGLIDPVVPAPPVRRWLKRECPGYRGSRLIFKADHNVLGTAPAQAADQIWHWLHTAGAHSGAAVPRTPAAK